MTSLKKSSILVLVIMIFSLSLSMISAGPTAAATHPDRPAKPSFSLLAAKFKRAAIRFGIMLAGATTTAKAAPKKAVAAVAKGADGQPAPTAAAAFKPTATPPLADGAPRVSVSASGPFAAEVGGAGRKEMPANGTAVVGYAAGTYYLIEDGRTTAISNQPLKFKPGAGSILNLPDFQDFNWNHTTNLNAFRGDIEVVYSAKSNQLLAVNELGLEDYLRGIAEAAHEAPEDHLKVMAIVSRSYMVHHLAAGGRHPGEPFHLKNSRNGNGDDQVYRGYLAETRQPRIAKAAGDTAGTVVTYQGKPVITPYSTQADGRTRSPAEAGWKVDWPWVQSVADPDTAGLPRIGHGVGLSGTGSRKRAERGATAAEILGYYFPGTSLGQVDTAGQIVRVSIYGQPVK